MVRQKGCGFRPIGSGGQASWLLELWPIASASVLGTVARRSPFRPNRRVTCPEIAEANRKRTMRKGRFSKPVAEMAQRYSESVSFDRRLFRQDIAGSIVHAAALEKAGIISPNERRKIDHGLRAIEREIETGKFRWDLALEDVHMNIEAALTKRIGAAGGKLHTARSRNDQVALDLRLYVKAEIAEISARVRLLQSVLLHLAERFQNTVLPGYTHFQRAQPIVLGHYFLAHIEALERDHGRIIDCARRADVLPLGSGAIAG